MHNGRIYRATEVDMFSVIKRSKEHLVSMLYNGSNRASASVSPADEVADESTVAPCEAKRSATDLAAELHLMQREAENVRAGIAHWGRVAQQAAARRNLGMAVEAVERQIKAEEHLVTYQAKIEQLVPILDHFTTHFVELQKGSFDGHGNASTGAVQGVASLAESRLLRQEVAMPNGLNNHASPNGWDTQEHERAPRDLETRLRALGFPRADCENYPDRAC
jgi:hypothetical protein